MNLYNLKRTLLSFIYPNRCPFCGEVINAGGYFCADCPERAGLCVYDNSADSVNDVFYCIYNEKSKPIIARAKENADGYAVSALAKLLHNSLIESGVIGKINVITAVPARKESLKKRGYSFPALLAKEIAGISGIRYSGKVLTLLREIGEQKGLSTAERAENLSGAFGIGRETSQGLKVLVIDDVSTTGATLNEAKRVIAEYAGEVYGAAVAKTVSTPSQPQIPHLPT
ncbi:MAG: double zinc ribbon domain-containing protein [Oscillospiraceae bacterium]|nr:double zinc ribbon domain-containing protein [Oscillospiraceae bacterium]